MQITNLFKKKGQKESAQTQEQVQTPIRDEKGRFIGKKKLKEEKPQTQIKKEKEEEKPEPIMVTFFSKEVRKIYYKGVWYFAVDDIYNIAYVAKEGETVTTTEKFDKVKKENSQDFDGVLYATADQIKKIINEIKGAFPGPFTRWLDESSQLPFITPPKPKEENE